VAGSEEKQFLPFGGGYSFTPPCRLKLFYKWWSYVKGILSPWSSTMIQSPSKGDGRSAVTSGEALPPAPDAVA
jgi:hypothetical protein